MTLRKASNDRKESTHVDLRAALIKRKISPSDFARLMGVSPTWVGKLLMGKATAGAELQKRIDAFLAICWVCGRRWPEAG